MKTNELREKYLDFFKSNGHTICPSDVLVPKWDPTVLFTPAGMNPFKDHFLGKVDLEFTRATSCQKCLRTGDIDNVGRTAYHHTFFEMLGNFSFGDYFKREAIQWAWKFLTDKKWLGIDPDRLTATVYLDDDEAFKIWNEEIGLPSSRITRMDEYDNFWPAGAPSDGPDGVCGPCSEIFYNNDDGSDVEIWNLVFTQFNRNGGPPDNLSPLPSKNIDTGMGLERAAATLQGVSTNYHIDILKPIVESAASVCGTSYDPDSESGRRLRRITDHVRACTFAIHENVYPGANKEQYVVKRLLRRAVLDGHQMGLREPFLYQLVPAVVDAMQVPYPEISETSERVASVMKSEEANFFASIDDGLARIDGIFSQMEQSNSNEVNGHDAADLYQTYGVPPELFEQIAKERGCQFDWDGFRSAMEEHGKQSGTLAAEVMGNFGPLDEIKSDVKSTEFLGYVETESSAIIVGVVEDESRPKTIKQSSDQNLQQLLILNRSPFYGESGGQVGDTGMISSSSGKFHVVDTQKSGGLIVHHGHVLEGSLSEGETVTATVDADRRDAIRRAHSATHILHHSLQNELGSHAQQRGSKVTDDWLRFDFTNLSPVESDQLTKIENESNLRVDEGVEVRADVLPLAEAKTKGAMMLFGEKYPDPVRMVSIGEFSKELCGGTHVNHSNEIEKFEILSEEGVSAGTRRIIALTGIRAREYRERVINTLADSSKKLGCSDKDVTEASNQLANHLKSIKKLIASGGGELEELKEQPHNQQTLAYKQAREILRETAKDLNVSLFDVPERIESMLSELQTAKEQLGKLQSGPKTDANTLIDSAKSVGEIKVIVAELENGNPNLMRTLIDQIRKKTNPVAVFLATAMGEDKVMLVAGFSRDLVDKGYHAGNWVKDVAPKVGGGGGGKPDLAQAGGKQPAKIPDALKAAFDFINSAPVGQ